MLRDMTLGQYYPGKSLLHRLDPRVKLRGALVFIISVFLFDSVIGFSVVTAFLLTGIILSGVPFRYMIKGIRPIIVILVFTGILNLFWTPGEPLWQYAFLKITRQGLINSGYMVVRLIYLVIGTSLMTLTTTPTRLTDGMETNLAWLNHFKVPVHEIAMMMSIALRFVPILLEETDKIMKAQMARGADFETGNFFKKAKNMIPLLVPLFVSAWRRASELAMAMEARCYRGGAGRTKMKPLNYNRTDVCAFLVLFLYLAGLIAIRIIV
ncbi:MAG: energy-coupling factor transporter transmembrane protein EcfT [Lachnospiraceae bacterium]|nr:energy-coupling factor transporter transmembrane protein EcfT [Lachnospiraceae bacterium]